MGKGNVSDRCKVMGARGRGIKKNGQTGPVDLMVLLVTGCPLRFMILYYATSQSLSGEAKSLSWFLRFLCCNFFKALASI